MKRALLVGIDHYYHTQNLAGCVNDVRALHPLLARNEDNTRNLDCKLLVSTVESEGITRDQLLEQIRALLTPGADFALLYFAGHGMAVNGDVSLATSDGRNNTPGVRFGEVLDQLKRSPVQEVVILLDCCFSGGAGTIPVVTDTASLLRNGLSVLTASRSEQESMETAAGRGLFSTYLEGALNGGAADVLGHITVAGLYAYLSESFGAWEQRPTFKANIDRLHDLRQCNPVVPLTTLLALPRWFPTAEYQFPLDPSYEPDAPPSDHERESIFEQLQICRAAKLVEPVGTSHMYYAAMQSRSCRLTPLGKHYRDMAKADRI
jgi:hypothetical protein